MSLSLSSLLLLLFSLSLTLAQTPFCNTTCRYEREVWSLYGYDESDIPESLWDNVPAVVQFDGDQSWYDNGCDALNFGVKVVDCQSCLPRYVYIYRQQKRILANAGKKESVIFLDFAYEPSQDNWDTYCTDDLVAPAFDSANDENTYRLRGADYSYSSGSSCYDRVFCSTTQSNTPLETAQSCTPNRFNEYPSLNYCGYDPTGEPENVTFRFGCNELGCESILIELPQTRKSERSGLMAKLAKNEKRREFDSDCEYSEDSTWYFNVRF